MQNKHQPQMVLNAILKLKPRFRQLLRLKQEDLSRKRNDRSEFGIRHGRVSAKGIGVGRLYPAKKGKTGRLPPTLLIVPSRSSRRSPNTARASVSSLEETHGESLSGKLLMPVQKSHEFPEMERFNDALRQAMQVSKADLKRLLAEDKITPLVPQKRGRKPKSVASDPVASDKG
jgi:hypothetical protein